MTLSILKLADVDGPENVSALLRELADEIDALPKAQKPKTVLVVQSLPDGVDFACFGTRLVKSATIGLLEYAKMMVYSGDNA